MFESAWMSATSFWTEVNHGRKKGTDMIVTQIILKKQQKHLLIVKLASALCCVQLCEVWRARSCEGWWIFRLQKKVVWSLLWMLQLTGSVEAFYVSCNCCGFGCCVVLWTEILHPLLYWDFFFIIIIFVSTISLNLSSQLCESIQCQTSPLDFYNLNICLLLYNTWW